MPFHESRRSTRVPLKVAIEIESATEGSLTCEQAEPWTFGAGALMENLSRRGLLASR